MSYKNIQEILPFVEKPSRYLGCEINTIRKDKNSIDLSFCLAFPDLYEIGTSHFGMQILYHILNRDSKISAERVFAPGKDMEACLRQHRIPLTSLESGTPLLEFDIVGFSLLYELNYTNILTILELAGISFYSSERRGRDPFVIAGGPCTCNPEPVAAFFDAMVIGDGEHAIMKIARAYIKWKKEGVQDREGLLKTWSDIEGVYIPSFFKTRYNAEGFQVTEARSAVDNRVKRTLSSSLEISAFPDKPVVPFGRPVHDRLRLEIARGCTRGCRFCQAGMIYRPVRERSVEDLVALAERSIRLTGYDDISLLSLSTGDYEQLNSLMAHLFCDQELQHVAVSFPSVRAGTLTPELMNLIKSVRKTGFTIAPEAGSRRLRNVINKNISEKEIFDTVEQAFKLGWNVIKLYFMIGLPTETDEDLMEIVRMVKALSKIKGSGKKKKTINVSITTFIPKPHTPFQWEKQISSEESRAKFNMIRDNLKKNFSVRLKWQNREMSLLEGVFARGDRRLSKLLVSAYNKGCRLDGWTEEFNFGLWKEAFKETGIDKDFLTKRSRDTSEPLPWDHIDSGVSKVFLRQELERALMEETIEDCRYGKCNQCGVCDFKNIEPKLSRKKEAAFDPDVCGGTANNKGQLIYNVVYEKKDGARFFGHLEMANMFIRAIKRAGINVKYSEGFHPKPKISFSDPIPVGMESLEESFRI
ncbi:MAG: TIGR03960 family B12-binding radical SAM protein, partial [Deltaproteobacteria bacterium]|nr:TIGR03960 family B12-binding radical SAM protein [Deltaproteobacteria bacterium]